jgi:hypothetical protein
MSIIAVLALSIWMLGAILLWASVQHAPAGYEDETGFHHGNGPLAVAELDVSREAEPKDQATFRELAAPEAEPLGARPPWPVLQVRNRHPRATAA